MHQTLTWVPTFTQAVLKTLPLKEREKKNLSLLKMVLGTKMTLKLARKHGKTFIVFCTQIAE